MGHQADLVIIGITVGVAIGILAAACAFFGIRLYRKRSRLQHHANESHVTTLPIRTNGIETSIDSCASVPDSQAVHDSQHSAKRNNHWSWWGHHDSDIFASTSGIPRYSYKDIQKATHNFTTILGQGSFGPVYKATMLTSEVVAIKVLASNSRQGEKEFQTEVLLLARLHHRNLVNLIGYCVDKGQHMLIYEFMSNGSLAGLLYCEGPRVLSWEERLQVALDVSHGIEYLHEGATPPVIHRDLKSANILLDQSMRAKVADFGLSKEEVYDGRNSGLKGTYGYMDPEYVSTNKFTKKSDIYSFGIILFELITAINPQQGLLDYINLAAMSADGKSGWDEILDKQLVGKCNIEEVRLLATIAYTCVQKVPRKRPSIVDVSQAISRIRQRHVTKEDPMSFSRGDFSQVVKRIEHQQVELSYMTSMKEDRRNSPSFTLPVDADTLDKDDNNRCLEDNGEGDGLELGLNNPL
ncbi:protein kinase superfamily protein [Tasmannia lanceolata]|uniref:protein kinase superfamily protein n=1 Tax=Tasmannia lanceolata TaxID=3420 RepID=UPI004063B766